MSTTSDPIRAALERLVKLERAFEVGADGCPSIAWQSAWAAARAALSAAPKGPSLEEVTDLCEEHCFNVEGYESIECLQGLINDALARWGRPAAPPAPVPAGEVAELVADHAAFAAWLAREMPPGTIIGDPYWWAPRIARRVIAMQEQRPTTTPAPAAGEVGAAIKRLSEMATDIEPGSLDRWTIENAAFLLEQLSATPPAPQPVSLSPQLLECLRDKMSKLQDEGPPGEGWASAELQELRDLVDSWLPIPATTPAPAAGEVGELVGRLGWIAAQCADIGWPDDSITVDRAAALLEQLSTAHPERLRHCPTHGQQPATAWGCPECVRELREQLSAVQAPQPVAVSERLRHVEDLAADAVSALRYIEQGHGRLYGVGWDRVYEKADRLRPAHALPIPAAPPAGQEGA